MNERESVNLDLVRAGAASLVFSCHFNQLGYTGELTGVLESLGRLGVICFFVLSGYVISYVQAEKHHGVNDYLRARLVRLYSVIVPALLLTGLLDTIGSWTEPPLYMQRGMHAGWIQATSQLPLFLTFMNENALFSVRWFSNGPLWSIAYEFWYYIGFAAFAYLRGYKRVVALCIVCVLAGWKIALLAPIWILGHLLYSYRAHLARLPRNWLLVGAIVSGSVLVLLCLPRAYALIITTQRHVSTHMSPGFHTFFISDYVIAVAACGLMLYVLLCLTIRGHLLQRGVRMIANSSFTLYVLHVPLILFVRAMNLYDTNSPIQSVVAASSIVLTCWAVSKVTENAKEPWYKAYDWILQWLRAWQLIPGARRSLRCQRG